MTVHRPRLSAARKDDIATASIDAGRCPEALQTVQRIKPPDSRAWALVWALIRISR